MTTEHEQQPVEPKAAGEQPAPEIVDVTVPEGAVAVDVEPEPDPHPLDGKTDEEIRALATEGAEYLALAQRTRADFDNYRKRALRDAAAAKVRGGVELVRELLPAIDNVERALEHEGAALSEAAGEREHAERILGALQSAHADLVAALARGGIERFDPLGEAFDPTRHEAVARRPAEADEAPSICGPVFQPGYAAGDEIIRPARVVVTD